MSKCEKDAATVCSKSASDKKLSGAAKSSHVKTCVSNAVGSRRRGTVSLTLGGRGG
jgi:hypothetical protein